MLCFESMNLVCKFLVYLLTFLFAVLLGGIYGALHEQISYSYSIEYFTQSEAPWIQSVWYIMGIWKPWIGRGVCRHAG